MSTSYNKSLSRCFLSHRTKLMWWCRLCFIFTARLHVMQHTVFQDLSLCPSLRQTCGLWQNERNLYSHSYTMQSYGLFETAKLLTRRCSAAMKTQSASQSDQVALSYNPSDCPVHKPFINHCIMQSVMFTVCAITCVNGWCARLLCD